MNFAKMKTKTCCIPSLFVLISLWHDDDLYKYFPSGEQNYLRWSFNWRYYLIFQFFYRRCFWENFAGEFKNNRWSEEDVLTEFQFQINSMK